MAALLLTLLVVYAWWAPQSLVGAAITSCGAKLAARLASLRPAAVFCLVALAAAVAGLVAFGKLDGLIMVGLAAPDLFAILLAVDVGVAAEVAAIAWLTAGRSILRTMSGRFTSTAVTVRTHLPLKRSTKRRHRLRRPRASAANDDDREAAPASALRLAA